MLLTLSLWMRELPKNPQKSSVDGSACTTGPRGGAEVGSAPPAALAASAAGSRGPPREKSQSEQFG